MESTGGSAAAPAKHSDSSVGEIEMVAMQMETEGHPPENGFVSPETTAPGLLTRIDQCVLPFLGGFGTYQKQLILLTWIPALLIGAIQFSDNFLLDQPNSTCVQPRLNVSAPTAAPSALSERPTNNGTRGEHVNNNGAYGSDSGVDGVQCNCSEWKFKLHTGLVQNVVTKWSLVCKSASEVHIAKFALVVGSSFGYLVFGILADWFGRHPMLIISVLFMLAFGLSVAFSINVPMFSILRFFEGFSLAGIVLSLYLLRFEICLPEWRFFVNMVACFLMLGGQLLMPVVAYLCRDWQILQVVIICPLVLMLSYIWVFPESLRWLLATQQYYRSNRIMEHIVKKNKVRWELEPENIFTELQGVLHIKPKKKCIMTMVGTRNLWKNIVVLCLNSLTGFGIHHCFVRSLMDPEGHKTVMFDNFYVEFYTKAVITVASCLALCPAVGLMGRRGGLLMFMIFTALASLLQLGLLNLLGKYSGQLNIDSSDVLNKNLSLTFSIIGMFSSYAVSILSIFICAEIAPTVIRGGGLGLVLASAGFGMLTGPIMDLHNQKGYFLHHIIFACCTLICIICILLLPETRRHPLPETLADWERYNCQTLLRPRKSGEQRLLLGPSNSNRDYTRVQDMALHEAATTVVSTMESTASSAVDLTNLSTVDVTTPALVQVHPKESDHKDPDGRSASSLSSNPTTGLNEDSVIHASETRPQSSTSSQKAPEVTDPLLAGEPPELDAQSVKSLTDSAIPEMNDSESTATKESATSVDSSPAPIPAALLISTTPVIEPRPCSVLESPDPVGQDTQSIPPESPQLSREDTQASLAEPVTPSMQDRCPPSLTPPPAPVSDISTESPAHLSVNSCPPTQSNIDPSLPSPTKHLPLLPVTDSSISLESDSSPPCVNSRPSSSPTPHSPKMSPSSSSSSSPLPCTDSGRKSLLDSLSPVVIDTVATTAQSPTILPVTQIVHPATPESPTDGVLPAQGSMTPVAMDSLQTFIECTVSSPIDRDTLSITDSASTDNNTFNGVASS